MADIFLSYKRTDRERVAPIIALLESRGWSVWWDTRIDAGEKWDEVIEREINAASCVVAVWSFESVASRWVRTEASEGLERGILVPLYIDPTKPPLEFKLVQSIDLTGWKGGAGDPAARALVGAIGRLVGQAPADVGQPPIAEERLDLPPLDQERSQREQEHWDLIRKSRDPRQFSVFMAAYPSGRYARAANARIEQLALRHVGVKRIAWAGFPGLIAGLLIVAAALLWLSGWLGGPQKKSVAVKQSPADQGAIKIAEVKPVKVQPQPVGPPPVPVAAPKPAPPPRPRVEELLAQAERRIHNGDITGAREILLAGESIAPGPIAFALAETYDPNMLAAWGTRGVAADLVRAKALYLKALELGDRRAQQRLEWLKLPDAPVLMRREPLRREVPRIIVAPTILAEPASQTALSIQVGPREALPNNSFVRLRGLPASVSLTEGHAIEPGSWTVPLFGLASLRAIVPAGVSGRAEIIISLVGVDGTTLAESRTALVVGPPTMLAPPAEKAPAEPQQKRALPSPAPAGKPLPRAPEISAEERALAERLVAQGKRHWAQGNPSAARMFFQRAAEAGLAAGAIGMAATYDPAELQRLEAQGLTPDRNEARKWYERARELGAPEADERLSRLGGK